MLISLFPTAVFAGNNDTIITIQSVTAAAGTTVDVPVVIKNNPGILGGALKFTFDPELTLNGATSGSAFSALTMTKPGIFSSPYRVIWDGQDIDDSDIRDGSIIILQFTVSENAAEGETYYINATYDDGDFVDKNLTPVDVTIANGTVSIVNVKYGDVNDDTKINTTDVIMTRRHIAGGYSQTINEQAADVNIDSKINTSDVILIRRYLTGMIDPLPYIVCKHNNLEAIPAKAATETAEGNIAYWRCTECGKYFSDENASVTIKPKDIIIPIIPKDAYSIQYECDMVPQAADTYRPAEGKVLPKPTLDKYTFVGWTDENGKVWDSIPVGTTGNITLYANWASNRNKAEPVKSLGKPFICEDSENGLIMFNYEIGTIKNVPLYTTLELQCANGIITSVEDKNQDTISQTDAKSVAEKVSNATTNSTAWTLSNDWDKTMQVSQTYLNQTGKTREEAETTARSSSGTYNIASSSGGKTSTTDTGSSSYKLSKNNGHAVTNSKENISELEVNSKISAGLTAEYAGIKGSLNAELGTSDKDTNKVSNSGTDTWSINVDVDREKSHTSVDDATWNSSSSFTSSNTISNNTSIANTVSSLISEQSGYGSSYSEGGSNSHSQSFSSTDLNEKECGSELTYFNSKITQTMHSYTSTGNTHGGYRMVMAGTVHVYAVVCYDVAQKEYFVYTYNVLGDGVNGDDGPKEYLDYSWDESFSDYETSIIPFEVPYFVHQYVNNRIAITDGLVIDVDNGTVIDYLADQDNPDTIVIIPSYVRVDNNDGTYSSVKITNISPELFKDNTNIVGVCLSRFITEIPESAFEGCTSLKEVNCFNVTKIGNNAFKGCTSLSTFILPDNTESIGTNAFEGVTSIKVSASTKAVAEEAAACNANNIVLDISNVPEDEILNMQLNVANTTSFELQGKDKEYKGLSIKSDAATTVINGVTFTENKKIPMELSSQNVTLDRVTVDCTGFALVLKNDNTNLKLNRNINLISGNENTVLCKNVTLSNLNSGIVGKLNVTGNVLTSGDISGINYLSVTNGEVIKIGSVDFDNYISAHRVSFDANGGTVDAEAKLIALNSTYGELPTPSRDYYTFDGWYTAASGGEKITADSLMNSTTDVVLYAHWTQNTLSAWTLASDVPEGAEIVDRKYTYSLTSYTTSGSPSLSGWTQYNSSWVWSDFGGWSGWQDSYVGGSDSRQVETQSVVASSNYKTVYVYHRWTSGSADSGSTYSYNTGYDHVYKLDYALSILENSNWYGHTTYRYYYQAANGNTRSGSYKVVIYSGTEQQWVSDNYKTQYRYRDRSQIYTYYFYKTEGKESSSYPSGDNISNVQEYVQYRTK